MDIKKINFCCAFLFFILVLVFFRLIPHSPNFSPIIASAIIAPLYLKNKFQGITVTLLAMFLSDILFLGFSSFQLFIYFTIGSIGLFSLINTKYYKYSLIAIIGSIWFYLVTNFGVWLIWDFYEKNINGLIQCYILAIPFFKNTLVSTIIFTYILLFLHKYYNNIVFNLYNYINYKVLKANTK